MSTGHRTKVGPSVEDGIRTLLLLMPRIVARIKRSKIPDELQSFSLAPRHLSLLAYLLFDGPMGVNELAARLEVAPATVSLMVSELSRRGVLDRREDDADRRRTIVSIAEQHHPAVDAWLSKGAEAWRKALQPLTPAQRITVIDALQTYERELSTPESSGTAR
ncbi:MarR family transcriptional regulator [Micromonospora sp. CA-240977]|uniref:MarR family transcriptional regulator n=1 Tax=Micromonospora sp. CA-240977 TaxID=3239957 RepID=UPI003D8E0C4A